jgi:hypothetical protein
LSCHFDVGLFHVIGHGGTPLAVLDDTHILTMTRALLGTLIRLQRIYNFLCSMLVFTPFAYCFVTLVALLCIFRN